MISLSASAPYGSLLDLANSALGSFPLVTCKFMIWLLAESLDSFHLVSRLPCGCTGTLAYCHPAVVPHAELTRKVAATCGVQTRLTLKTRNPRNADSELRTRDFLA